jgi:hypothetical protein
MAYVDIDIELQVPRVNVSGIIGDVREAAGKRRQPRALPELGATLRNWMVGAAGLEPATLCSQSRCATKLRHAPAGPRMICENARPSKGRNGNGR